MVAFLSLCYHLAKIDLAGESETFFYFVWPCIVKSSWPVHGDHLSFSYSPAVLAKMSLCTESLSNIGATITILYFLAICEKQVPSIYI